MATIRQVATASIARSFHFATFTPLTRSHKDSDNSPINDGMRIAGVIRFENTGAQSAEKEATK